MTTYYTKCGQTFEKSTKAAITGYTLDLQEDGRLIDYVISAKFEKCLSCPFKVKVTEGWPPRFKRWECRAGSQPPNHTNDWTGSLEDKNTIRIRSLDNDFLEAVLKYCGDHPDLAASYNQDLADCRRQISVSCSQNKKGIAAKKALIEKFFSEAQTAPDEKYEQIACDKDDCPFNNMEGTCCFADEDPDSDGYQQDVIEAVQAYDCKNEDVLLSYKVITDPDSCDLPESEDDESLFDELKCRVCGCTDSNGCPGGCYWVEDDLCSRCAEKIASWHPKCPYLGSISQYEIHCQVHCHRMVDAGFEKESDVRKYAEQYCFKDFDKCETYHKYYQWEMESTDKNILQFRKCAYCCNNSGYTGLTDQLKGSTHGFCQVKQEDVELYNPDAICQWFNMFKREGEVNPMGIAADQKCLNKTESCSYFCKHNDGCTIKLVSKKILPDILKQSGEADCQVYKDAAKQCLKPEMCKSCNNEMDNGCLPPVSGDNCIAYMDKQSDAVLFDYSTVDQETAAFLQEKAARITEIRIKSVVAIGKELKEAHDRLANNKTGVFGAWCESIGISRDTANNYLRAYKYIAENFGNIDDAERMQPSLLFAISKPSANPALAEMAVVGDITTYKEYRELEQKYKQLESLQALTDETLEQLRQKNLQEKRELENQLIEISKELDQTREALKHSKDAHKSKNDLHKNEVAILENRIKQLQGQIEDLQAQQMDKPVEVAIKEIIPEDIKKELDQLKRKQPVFQDYEHVGKLLNEVSLLTIENIWNWANTVRAEADRETIAELRIRTEKALKVAQEIHRAIAPKQTPALDFSAPNGECSDCRFSDIDAVTEEQLDQDLTFCTIYKKPVKFDNTCVGFVTRQK